MLEKKERDDHGQQKWQWAFCALKEGVADIPQIVRDLRDVGYRGYVSLEEFGPGNDGEKIAAHGAYLQELVAAKGRSPMPSMCSGSSGTGVPSRGISSRKEVPTARPWAQSATHSAI